MPIQEDADLGSAASIAVPVYKTISIAVRENGKCITRTSEDKVIAQNCDANDTNQAFVIKEGGTGGYTIQAKSSDKCLDLPDNYVIKSTSYVAPLLGYVGSSVTDYGMHECNYQSNQRFYFAKRRTEWIIKSIDKTSIYTGVNGSMRCLDLNLKPSGPDRGDFQLFDCHGRDNQTFTITERN